MQNFRSQTGFLWNFTISFFSAYVTFNLVWQVLHNDAGKLAEVFEFGDTVACCVFFLDLVWRWGASGYKLSFWKTSITELLACIPAPYILRTEPYFWILRLFQILRGFYGAKFLTEKLLQPQRSKLVALCLIALFGSVFISSELVLHFESFTQSANIKNIEDATWWAFSTITTVGYGDVYPVTSEGRIVGICLMFAGISLFGITSAALAGMFVRDFLSRDKRD